MKVSKKYDGGNDDWLAMNGNANEWAVAFHGVKWDVQQVVGSIV